MRNKIPYHTLRIAEKFEFLGRYYIKTHGGCIDLETGMLDYTIDDNADVRLVKLTTKVEF